jgi:hypothetical protein
VLALAACGGEVDLTGTYRVYDQQQSVCGTPLSDVTGTFYIVMHPIDVGYQANCFGDASLVTESFAWPDKTVFDHAIDGGWRGTAASTGHDSEGGACWVDYLEASVHRDGDRLLFDLHKYQQNATLTGIPCTVDEANRRGSTLQLCSEQTVDATRQ